MQRHAGRYMTLPTDITTKHPSATCSAGGFEPPLLEAFWGRRDAAKALHRECLEIIARKYPSFTKPVVPPRKPRKPSIRKLIAEAEKATGKMVWAITMPDGTRLDFRKVPNATVDDEVETWLSKQKRH
jgi:hypothetical protein